MEKVDRKGVNRKLYIGIDPGTHTGVAVWDKTSRRMEVVDTMTITRALELVTANVELCKAFGGKVVVYIEDARKRTWFGSSNREKLQGAGSVKRDCAIWEAFCKELGVEDYSTRAARKGHECAMSYLESNVQFQTGSDSQLNPRFVAEMMGFPPDWTALPFIAGDETA